MRNLINKIRNYNRSKRAGRLPNRAARRRLWKGMWKETQGMKTLIEGGQ